MNFNKKIKFGCSTGSIVNWSGIIETGCTRQSYIAILSKIITFYYKKFNIFYLFNILK